MNEIVQRLDNEKLATDEWVYLGEFYGVRDNYPSGKNQSLTAPSNFKEVLFITKQSENRYVSEQILGYETALRCGYYLPYGTLEEIRALYYTIGGVNNFQIYNGPYKGSTNMENSQEAKDLVTKVYVKY